MASWLLSGNRRLCRLCLTDQEDLHPIYGGEVADLAVQIYDCTRIEIKKDGMPALICQQCRAKIVVCQHFFGNCQKGDRKYRRLFGQRSRQDELDDSRTKPRTLEAKQSPPSVSTEVVANKTIPKKQTFLDRLKNDDQTMRRHSIDEASKIDTKYVAKKRLSDESHVANTLMEPLAIKIEQSLQTDENDQKDEVNGKRECPKCGILVQNLQQHKHKEKLCNQATNPTIGKHVCGICNKSFKKRFLLKYHVNQHTGEKPFKCSECDKCFAHPGGLYQHKQSHGGGIDFSRGEDQRYYCNVCHCAFKHRNLIHKHMRTYHRERKFTCETCGKAYFTKEYLNKHMRLIHNQSAKYEGALKAE